jgi:hypothetical protein
LCALWKKQMPLPSLAFAGIPYQVLGERVGALALMMASIRSAHGSIRFRHLGNFREHVTPSGCLLPHAGLGALSPSALERAPSLRRVPVRESVDSLAGHGGANGGLLCRGSSISQSLLT